MSKLLPKALVFVLCLLPFILLVLQVLSGDIIDPIEEITNPTGQWALRFLLLTLAISPIVKLSKKGYLMRFRRMLGLFAFFYACLHLSIWLIDQSFAVNLIIADVIKRNYITLGFLAFLLLIPLVITSTNKQIKRLGAKKWKKIHQLIYPITVLVCVHFYWQAKSATDLEPMIYATIAILLLLFRVRRWRKNY